MKKQIAQKARGKPRVSRKKAVPQQKRMTDKPKPWPLHAAEARDRSAEEALAIVRQASESLEMTNDPGLLKKIAKILVSANLILRQMESQGAKTRP
jgi:hypothetical protein